MKTIAKWGSKKLELETEFDSEQELELTILDKNGDDTSVWLNEEEVKQLIEHLQNVLQQSHRHKSKTKQKWGL